MDYQQEYYKQENDLRELHYRFLKELGTALPVGLPKISTVEAYEQIFEIMKKDREKIKFAAKLMYDDLIALNQAVPDEAARMFGKETPCK